MIAFDSAIVSAKCKEPELLLHFRRRGKYLNSIDSLIPTSLNVCFKYYSRDEVYGIPLIQNSAIQFQSNYL